MSLMDKAVRYISDNLTKVRSGFLRKDDQSVIFVPHDNCKNDKYDIINYKSDNVLCLFNYMLCNQQFQSYHFYIVYYDKDKLNDYISYCIQYNSSRVKFIYYEDSALFKSCFVKCKYIFTDHYYTFFKYRTSNQVITCLSYYPAPFKDDFWKITEAGGYKYQRKYQAKINASYDYHLSNSDITSTLIARDSQLYYPKFLSFGYPRDFVFYSDSDLLREKIIKMFNIHVDHIITYTPTHRDYENEQRSMFSESEAKSRSIWGYAPVSSIEYFDKLLEETNTLIIAKIHPAQAKNLINENHSNRVVLYSELAEKMTVSLNELLAISDVLITDYTSAVFDFMHVDRPIIFYMYDYNLYDKTRGFTINPITPFCSGDVVYDLPELSKVLMDIMHGTDRYACQRRFVMNLLNKYHDGNASERIVNYFFNK